MEIGDIDQSGREKMSEGVKITARGVEISSERGVTKTPKRNRYSMVNVTALGVLVIMIIGVVFWQLGIFGDMGTNATITGGVIDGYTGRPLVGVEVDIFDTANRGSPAAVVRTDGNGTYSASVAGERNYEVWVRIGEVNPKVTVYVKADHVYPVNFEVSEQVGQKSLNAIQIKWCDTTLTNLQRQDLFDKEFYNKYIIWTGKVQSVSDFGGLRLDVNGICPNAYYSDMDILMREDQRDELLKLKVGDTVKYKARLRRFIYMSISADDGVVLNQT